MQRPAVFVDPSRNGGKELTLEIRFSELYITRSTKTPTIQPHCPMDLYTIILLIETLVIAGLSTYVWLGMQDQEHIKTMHWVALFVLVLFLTGFAVTLSFSPLGMG